MRNDLQRLIDTEMREASSVYGEFNSPHELFGVLKEEMDEYWDSIRADEENLYELVQVVAVAARYILERLDNDKLLIGDIEAKQSDRWGIDE